ncbi:PE-PGRS family protein [Amycolatopsis sp. A133]|uniref:beta strand repeat-containing protein n=1 Tax=Amycolatopsis sp. A133 TaxID=3064472 RepID=UPI0027FDED3C|nr:PE-PGRS family protein [Amycolatopsis sp. A133]MDQ7810013.1 PE-PGRS family protein [Amycolatopsis sp. A133]
MQTWAKRGLQTAFVTGGLLMLGTGIASADENVSPDTPASPLDLNVTAPIQEANNAVGTPFGQLDLPAGQTELSTKPISKAVNQASEHLDYSSPINDTTLGGASGTDGAGGFTPGHKNLKGNKISGDVVVPIQIVDNAIGVVGDAHVNGTRHQQSWGHDRDVKTTGEDSSIAGNAVILDWALPVQIAGNGGGVAGGTGRVTGGSASQSTTETGEVDTDGDGSALSGNVVAGQFATPVQVTGNAASYLLGNGQSHGYSADTVAASGGSLLSSGDKASGSGNVVGAPIALPAKFNCNSGAAWGSLANSDGCDTAADATAGATRKGSLGIPTYLETSGDDSFLSGNGGAASLSPIANVAGVAGSWIGNASSGVPNVGSSSSTVDSGGFVKTTGDDSTGSGNVLNPSLALPVEAFGIGGTYIGQAIAAHDNTTDANAGNGSYTKGNGAVLGGNIVNTQAAGAPEVFGVGGSHIGNASGTATEDKTVTSGAYDGTQGNDSAGSGNLVQVPLGVPAEVFGIGGSFVGQGSGAADETKVVSGGGGGSTQDDNGFLSSNLGTVPASLPVQAANIGGALVGQGHGKGSTDTTSNAGGDVKATGPAGAGAGNIVEAPVSLPLQAMGVGGALAGIGTGENDNITDSSAGGDALTDGRDGALTGNIVKAPVAGAGTVFGDGLAAAALGRGAGTNDVESEAGGDATTNGDRGSVAGNIVGADALPVAQVFGDAASVLGGAKGTGINMTEVENAGDDSTSGVEGALSGNILDLPVTAIAQMFGDAATVGGVTHAIGGNTLETENGGKSVTAGDHSSLSGNNLYGAFAAPVQIFGVPFELLGVARAEAANLTSINEDEDTLFPTQGSELAAGELPSLAAFRSGLPAAHLPVKGLPSLGGLPLAGLTGGLPSLDRLTGKLPLAVPTVAGLAGNLPTAGLPVRSLPAVSKLAKKLPDAEVTADGLPAVPTTVPVGIKRADLPSAGKSLAQLTKSAKLPAVGGLSGVPALPKPALPAVGGVLPAQVKRADLPTAGLPVAMPALPAVGGVVPGQTPRAGLPAAGLPVAMPALPAVGGVLPGQTPRADLPTGALPVAMPALPALGGVLPGHAQRADLPTGALPVAVPALPTDSAVPTLPATSVLPASPADPSQLPVSAKLPVLNSVPATQVPAMSGLDSTGFLAKLLGLIKRK